MRDEDKTTPTIRKKKGIWGNKAGDTGRYTIRPATEPSVPPIAVGAGAVHGQGMTNIKPTTPKAAQPPTMSERARNRRKIGAGLQTNSPLGRQAVKPKSVVADIGIEGGAGTLKEQPRKPSFNAADTIPRNLERFDLGSALKDIYKKNASKFGPDTKTGGRDIYEMKGGERTGRILESSSWLKPGNAFSSNAWEKTVGGQPNQNYDKNAIMPEGYRNEAGTFIPGPRVKAWEPLWKAKNQGERDIAMKAFAEKSGTLDPETGRIGSELARRGDQKLEGIKGRYLESVAKIRANADVESAGIRADAYTSMGADSGPSAAQNPPEASWKESDAGKFYDAKSPISPGEQMAELPDATKQHIDKMRNTSGWDAWYRAQDLATREKIRGYLGR